MAASYVEGKENIEGLILLASYAANDLSDTDLSVLSVYGSEDGVLNMQKYEENRMNLPEDMKEVIRRDIRWQNDRPLRRGNARSCRIRCAA